MMWESAHEVKEEDRGQMENELGVSAWFGSLGNCQRFRERFEGEL
jgi:hypothetical protein